MMMTTTTLLFIEMMMMTTTENVFYDDGCRDCSYALGNAIDGHR